MTYKLISVVALLSLAALSLMSWADASDPLFQMISMDPLAVLLKLSLVAAMLLLAFKNYINEIFLRASVAGLGLGLIAFGATGLLEPALGNALFEYLRPLDLLLLVESGVVFSATALERQAKPTYRAKQSLKAPVKLPAPATSSA